MRVDMVYLQPVDPQDETGEQAQMCKRAQHHQRFDRNQRLLVCAVFDISVQSVTTD